MTILLMSDIAEFNKNKDSNNLKRNLMIGAGLLGGVALTTIGVRSYLRNGKLVRQSTRKVNKVVDEVIDPMKLTTPKEIIDNHQSVMRLVVPHRLAKNFKEGQVLNPDQLDELFYNSPYFRIDNKNTPTSTKLKLDNTIKLDDDSMSDTYIEIAHTAKSNNTPIRYYIKEDMNKNNKGLILLNRHLRTLDGMEDFNRII
jgi:hypothetical protein